MISPPFREITPHFESADCWNDVTINAGASQSTLQDIKLPEYAGCYGYKTSATLTSPCSNRFIYWRIYHDVIELCEVSLDINLTDNQLRLRFQNTPILRGVSVSEQNNHVVLLVPTVSAIFCITFPHPRTIEPPRHDLAFRSVFHDTTSNTIRSRYHVLNHVSLGIPLPHTSCSWMDGHAHFVMANNSGSVLLITMSERSEVATTELMKTGSIFRLLNGLTTAIRGTKTEMALSIVSFTDQHDTYIFALFSDLHIRVWSYKKKECILVDSILNYDFGNHLTAGNFTIHQCYLHISEKGTSPVLGVYVPVPHQNNFYFFNPILDHEYVKLKFLSTLVQAEHDLVDFCISSSYVWSLWLSCENQPIVMNSEFDDNGHPTPWFHVNVEEAVPPTIDYSNSNPQDAYLREIFKAGRFLPSSISKAISIYKPAIRAASTKKPEDLRGRAIEAVEGEILLRAGSMGMDSEWVEIAAEAWDRFFSYCLQYEAVGTRPLALSAMPETGLVALLKKSCCSLLCIHDMLSVSLAGNGCKDDSKQNLHEKLLPILNCVDLVQKSVDGKHVLRLEDRLRSHLNSPLPLIQDIVKHLQHDAVFLSHLLATKPPPADIIYGIEILLEKLDLSTKSGEQKKNACEWGQIGGSIFGVSALCSGLSHFVRDRFTLCLHLMLLELALDDNDVMDDINQLMNQSSIIIRTLNLLRCYYILMWCTQCELVPVSASIQEVATKQFCLLERPDFTSANFNPSGRTVIHAFFQTEGGQRVRSLLPSQSAGQAWDALFPQLVAACAALLWPLAENVLFPEFLYAKCQHGPLKEYSELLVGWCNWSRQLLQFLQAANCLQQGDEQAALKLFLIVSRDIEPESLLCSRVLRDRHSSLCNAFFMRVIEMFEQFGFCESIIQIATEAITVVDASESATFHSVLFRKQLNLGRWEEAADAITSNPDCSCRKDCLRQLLLKLCQQKKYQDIVRLADNPFEEDVVSILESRARCSDLRHNTSFYKVLFSLHVHQQKYRRAAAVMYELAMRFSREVVSIRGLKKQSDCLLAAINCLHLAEPKHAWIVKPLLQVSESEDSEVSKNSKRNSEGEIVTKQNCPLKVEVLGLEEIHKEYCLVEARLLHSQWLASTTRRSLAALTPLAADEIVALLLSAGLFDAAIRLSKVFSLALVPVFEALTHKWLSSSYHQDDTSERSFYSKGIANYSNRLCIENLVEKLLFEYELPSKSDLHRCITEKLLSHGLTIPVWLESSYQKCNFTELVSLYICHGLVLESTILMSKYVKAVMGIRKEDFGLDFTLGSSSPPVWLPYTYIDILLSYGKEESTSERKEAYEELIDILDKYNSKLESTLLEMQKRHVLLT